MGTNKNLTNTLFSKAQQKILALLYCHPEQQFYTNEIIRFSKIGIGAILRELENLKAADLITVTQVGNQKYYQANSNGNIFDELHSIVLKTFGMADILKEALLPFADKIEIAFVYGSIAKQKNTATSDIDLMVITNDLTYADLFPTLEQVEQRLGSVINPTCYSSSEWIHKLKEKNNFITQITTQSKIFVLGTEHELCKLGKSD